ncbi:MAG: NifU family protein [Candidatus Azosocius agrarius]|nr:MAG: NifU family protein [Gammaproteobacteria bacterium]
MNTKEIIKITDEALNYINIIIKKYSKNKINLRIFVKYPHTEKAEVNLIYCYLGEELKNDYQINYDNFILFIDNNSLEAIKESIIDYEVKNEKKKLSIKAPNIKKYILLNNKSFLEQIRYIFDTEISVMLSSHGGNVELIELKDNGILVIKFGGSCHGCGMVNTTLTQSIEKIIKEKFPEIKKIEDITEHHLGLDPFY